MLQVGDFSEQELAEEINQGSDDKEENGRILDGDFPDKFKRTNKPFWGIW